MFYREVGQFKSSGLENGGRGFVELDDPFGVEEDVRLLRLLPPEMMGRAELDRIGVAQSLRSVHASALSGHGATPSSLPIRLF